MPKHSTFYTEAIPFQPQANETANALAQRQLDVAGRLARWPGWASHRLRGPLAVDIRSNNAPLVPTPGEIPTLGWDTPGEHDLRLTLLPHPGGRLLALIPQVLEWAQSDLPPAQAPQLQ